MAAITNDEQFRLACSYLVSVGLLPVQGERVIAATARKVYDQRGAGIENQFDITPNTATLESALDSANAAVTDENSVAVSSDIGRTARRYLRDQLRSANPNLGTIFTQIKTYIDSNAQLLLMLNNNIDVMALAYGWNAANVKAATGASSNLLKAQYVEAAKSIAGIFI